MSTTGLRLVLVTVLWFVFISVLFIYFPQDTFVISGSDSLTQPPDFLDEGAGDVDTAGLIDFFIGLFGFNIEGLGVVSTIFFVYLPILIFGLGIFGIIRGI